SRWRARPSNAEPSNGAPSSQAIGNRSAGSCTEWAPPNTSTKDNRTHDTPAGKDTVIPLPRSGPSMALHSVAAGTPEVPPSRRPFAPTPSAIRRASCPSARWSSSEDNRKRNYHRHDAQETEPDHGDVGPQSLARIGRGHAAQGRLGGQVVRRRIKRVQPVE